jgi:polysaccharide pyruvyl transferase WcaK-like protein
LYLAITEEAETRREFKPWPRRLKSLTKHSLDRVVTRLSHRLHLDVYHYEAAHGQGNHSNRGDIAIRIAIKQQLAKAFAPRPVNFLEVRWGELDDKTAEEINHSCDIFVIGGGGYIFLNADGAVGHMLENVEELGKIRCPVFAYGIGLNRLMHEKVCDLDKLTDRSRQKIRYLAKKCELIGVRDSETAKLFEQSAAKLVALTGDPVLSYREQRLPSPIRSRDRPVIGINLAAHGWRTLSMLKPLLPTIIAFFKDVQRTHHAELLYLQHHDLERPVIEFLHAEGLNFELVSGTPDDLMNGYARTDFVVCQMLHACIFAAAAGKPFLGIAYDEKIIAFGKLLGVAECCLPHRGVEPALLEQTFVSLFQNRAALREKLEARKKVLQLAQTRFVEKLVAETERLGSQYDFSGKDDQPGDLPYLLEAEISAIVKQAGNTISRLH